MQLITDQQIKLKWELSEDEVAERDASRSFGVKCPEDTLTLFAFVFSTECVWIEGDVFFICDWSPAVGADIAGDSSILNLVGLGNDRWFSGV